MKNQITIAKPDASRSCHHCRKFSAKTWSCPINPKSDMELAKSCQYYSDTRRTSQVISASGKVFD